MDFQYHNYNENVCLFSLYSNEECVELCSDITDTSSSHKTPSPVFSLLSTPDGGFSPISTSSFYSSTSSLPSLSTPSTRSRSQSPELSLPTPSNGDCPKTSPLPAPVSQFSPPSSPPASPYHFSPNDELERTIQVSGEGNNVLYSLQRQKSKIESDLNQKKVERRELVSSLETIDTDIRNLTNDYQMVCSEITFHRTSLGYK
uniref:Uncharacterized protein LOC111102819 n=1 Tax=Crassostrea virginica TaxID=6565 RepID=A0A8B8AIQ2_CRAVI|nr:uncharacterized protein LOC111102819 [Crassostrea virginica]